MRNLLNSIFSGFGRTLGRFLFYLFVGLLVYFIFDKWEVNALNNNASIVEVNATWRDGNNINSYNMTLGNNNLFLYENQYYSDLKYNTRFYTLGFGTSLFSQLPPVATDNINFYFPNSCGANNTTYQININFTRVSGSINLDNLGINTANSNCTGFLSKMSDSYYQYQLSCIAKPNDYIVGSLYFYNQPFMSNALANYRIGIQHNFTYSCELDTGSIIQNQNINTDRTIQAITDLNGNVTIVNNSINNLNDSINDDTPPSDSDLTNFFDTLRDDFPTNNTISQLLLLPLNILHIFLTNIQNGCSPFVLPFRFRNEEQNYLMKCVNIADLVKDNNVVNIIDLGMLIGLFFTFSQTIINMWNTLIHLRDEFEEQYVPQHIGGPRVTRGKMRGDY